MKLYTSGVALVTGAGQGIGKATALSFAESGVRGLVLAGRTPAPLHATALECKAIAENTDLDILVVLTDISIEESVKNLMKTAVDHFGRVDYCANVGGMMGTKAKFSSISTEDWVAIQQTNINGIFWLVREQISVMEKQERLVTPIMSPKRPAERGSIVVLSAAAAVIALPDGGAYTHTKYAANGLTKAAAQDHASNGIRINAILPGYIYTEGLASHPAATPEAAKRIIDGCPLGRFGEAGEIGDLIVMMSSPRNGFMVGSSVLVDGGQTLSGE
ncbi:NAD(P)-binding protein [Guyanagaster necrorhizus]|uniref:NAD(P)-binding protein n=1 Tax=Guyanagaster necrorhizus TaxID=856835 RepID=A0A9P7VK21_9AGAR|nr:NAD(P)-binding protein [Guyanagaster necrorhizus MCA 3950]KAG7441765.1 NAD(P)-binding protein [Guyanagaster necrorhizus MCA 3950]